MKKIIKRFWGVAIVVVLLSSLLLTAPAQAGAQAFSYAPLPSEPIPSPIGITAIGTVVYDFAVADTAPSVIYAATSDNALKSTNQGRTWAKINNGPAGSSIATNLVAVAPDDEDVVVYVDRAPGLDVRLSLNGGVSFFDLGVPSNNVTHTPVTAIFDVDISREFTDLYGYTYRYIGIAGADTGVARFYYVAFGAYAPYTWFEAVTDWTPGVEYTVTNDCFFAVKFSPAFNIDGVAYLLAQNTAPTKRIELHVVSFNILTLGGGQFNHMVSGFTWYDENVAHWTGEGTAVYANPGAGAAVKGQIIFSPGYSGVYYSPYARQAYCSVATAANEGGAFVIFEDSSARPVVGLPGAGPYPAGSGVPIVGGVGGAMWSIALNAAGTTLQAAAMATAATFKCTAPWVGPFIAPCLPVKQIGGGPGPLFPFGGVSSTGSNMTIFYAGDNVLCAKSGDMGAFSLSRNDGYTWNDISLVNTDMSNINDQAIKADGIGRYVVSQGRAYNHQTGAYVDISGVDHASVWYYDGTYWERVFCRFDANGFVIRNSPVSFGAVYMGDQTTGTIYYTSTYGLDDWRWRLAPLPNTTVADIEVVDDATLYAAVNVAATTGYVCPLLFSGLWWNASDYIQVFGAAQQVMSLSLVSAQEVIAGSDAGRVAYTTTGGNTPGEWVLITGIVGNGGSVYTDAASLAPFSIIYAVENTAAVPGPITWGCTVWAWMLGASTTAWAPVDWATTAPFVGTATAFSVDVMIYGTGTAQCIYALFNNGAAAGAVELDRSFLDEAFFFAGVGGWLPVGYTINPPASTTGGNAGNTPDALKGSDDPALPGNKVWFINTTWVQRYLLPMRGFGETHAFYPQIMIYTDELAETVPTLTSPIDGYIVQVNKQTGTAYDVALVWTAAAGATSYYFEMSYDSAFTVIVAFGTPVVSPIVVGPWSVLWPIQYQPGEILYWHVRADGPFFSRWSQTFTLNIQAAPIPVPELYAPANGGDVYTLTPAFSWSPMSGTAVPSGITTTYTLWVGTDPAFAAGTYHEYQVTNTTGFVMPASVLADLGVYYWRVCTDIAPHTNWSATASFTVDLAAGMTTTTETEIQYSGPATVGVPSGSASHTDNVVNPAYIWAIIIIGAVLVVAIIVLIFRAKK